MPHSQPALLLVAFGSSLPHTAEIYAQIMRQAQSRYTGHSVYMAYSSRMVLAKLSREGRHAPDIATTMQGIVTAGHQDLLVLPLFAIAGEDFNKWRALIVGQQAHFRSLTIGNPLLYCNARVGQVAAMVLQAFPERAPTDLLVLMGHGSPHSEGDRFRQMATELAARDARCIFGCVEGDPDFSTVVERLQSLPGRDIVLAPFMMVTGDHAMNDMAGPEPDSWKSQLEALGYNVTPVQRGLLEIPALVDLLLENPA